MKVLKFFIPLLLFFSGCKQEALEKVSYEEFLAMVKETSLPDLSLIKKIGPFGNEISQDSLINLYREYDLEEEMYKNASGEIVEIRFKPKPAIKEIKVDCKNMESQLDSIRAIDQAARDINNYDPKADYANLELVINIMRQCGMPETQKGVKSIFLVLQHNHHLYQKRYIDKLKIAAEQGKIDKASIAMMEDRILVNDGKPQLYGSQVSRKLGTDKWELDELFEPERVNIRRARMGLGPIQEYLENYDIKFNVEQETE